ncbi:helix-turn-helix domain-containing protein [Chryseobacterium indoltheticum]|uniref:helix-turn-helix domain-containing protein n=1 Tax=Chryseobacterium indoltheticum TaxID=254 RepID=UPI0011C07934|nr:helix-turn-helix domain-containing protein [Chryseobacterium indoltheticum]
MKTKKYTPEYSISEFRGLYVDRHTKPGEEYLLCELLETRSSDFEWKVGPHTHPGLFQVFFIYSGGVEFHESNNIRKLSVPCAILIPPTVLHGFNFKEDTKGRILTIAEGFLFHICQKADYMTTMFNSIIIVEDFDKHYSEQKVKECIERLAEELMIAKTGKEMMTQAILQELFIIFFKILESTSYFGTEAEPVNLGYYQKFQRIMRDVDAQFTVKKISSELGITSVHLNRICKKNTGKSAGTLIDERLLEESKKLLTYTSYSIAEVAYFLKFDYPNYFARFFKKHTALTPSQYRKQLEITIDNLKE